MGSIRFAVALVVLTVSAPAFADESPASASASLNAPESITELPASLRVPSSVLARMTARTETSTAEKRKTKGSCTKIGCGYKAILGNLVITRDFQASEDVSVRVLPTAHALGGDDASTAILLRPRVNGAGQYGLHLRAKF